MQEYAPIVNKQLKVEENIKMLINIISKDRGIYSIYNGKQYLIYSSFYGMVAKSILIQRDNENDVVDIVFDMCDWSGYWDLASIIKRGIRKLENQWVYKRVNIDIVKRKDGRQNLGEYYEIVKVEE